MNIHNARFLITGSSGQLASEFQRVLSEQGMVFSAPSEDLLDITDPGSVDRAIEAARPDVIVNCAAYNAVDAAEREPHKAFAVNRDAVGVLARRSRAQGILLVHFSSDYVFDGGKGSPYEEGDAPGPINVYGMSKLAGEGQIREAGAEGLILRLSWVFGPGRQNFFFKLREWAAGEKQIAVVQDETSVPTYVDDVVAMTLKGLSQDLRGLYHLVNSGQVSRYDLARYYVARMGIGVEIEPASQASFGLPARRPVFSAMSNQRLAAALGIDIPSWQDAVDRFVDRERQGKGSEG